MLASEIIYEIQNLRSKGRQVDDNQVSDEMIYSFLCNHRAMLLRREIDQNSNINSELLQTFWMEVQPNTTEIFGCDEITFKNCLLKSVEPLPKSIQLKNGDALFYVGTVDNNKAFSYLKRGSDLKHYSLNRYTGKREKYFIQDNYLYVYTNNPALRIVKVEMIAEDPKKLIELNDITKKTNVINPFDPFNFEFPIGRHLIDAIINLLIQTEYRLLLSVNKEDLNDNKNQN